MGSEIKEIKKQLEEIQNRNKNVELNKAWETSNFRKVLIAVLTYILITVFFHLINVEKPFVNAIVPTIGFLLSTLSLSIFKSLWVKYIYDKQHLR